MSDSEYVDNFVLPREVLNELQFVLDLLDNSGDAFVIHHAGSTCTTVLYDLFGLNSKVVIPGNEWDEVSGFRHCGGFCHPTVVHWMKRFHLRMRPNRLLPFL